MEILATLHPENNPNDDLFPNVKKENIPSKAINLEKLSDDVKNKLPKVISSDSLLPATKLKYLEIDGNTYSIPQRVDVTSNIKITGNKSDILSSTKNLLCILSKTSSLAIKVVDKIEGGVGSFIANSQLPDDIYNPVCGVYKNCIYFSGVYKLNVYVSYYYIYKYDISTNAITKIKSSDLKYGCGTIVGNKMYIFGGTKDDNKTMIIDLDTLEYTNDSIGGYFTYEGQCCASIGTDIYVFGGRYYNSDYYYNNKINKIDTLTNTCSILSTATSEHIYGACCASIGNCIYIFGGAETNYGKYIYKFNSLDGSITRLSVSLPIDVKYYPCVTYGKLIYIFTGSNIIIFDSETETCEYLTSVSSVSFEYSGACIFGNNVYLIGGNYKNYNYTYNITFDLPTNEVHIFIDNSSKYNFDLITDQVTIPIKNIYIGDSSNTAQLANAYLYDETQTAWINVNTGEVLS